MPIHKCATNSSQFAELLGFFPCPAWIEDLSGRILACNTYHSPTQSLHPVKTEAFPLPLPDNPSQSLRLVTLLPDGQEMECLRRVIATLLKKTFQSRQTIPVDEALFASLTPQQREIYREITPGCSYKEIATHLGLTHGNVLFQVYRIRKILGADMLPYQRKKRRWHAN